MVIFIKTVPNLRMAKRIQTPVTNHLIDIGVNRNNLRRDTLMNIGIGRRGFFIHCFLTLMSVRLCCQNDMNHLLIQA